MQFKRLFCTITFLFIPLLASFAQKPMLLDHGGGVRTVEFSPVDASLVASAGESSIIKLWNLRNNTARTLRGHTAVVNSVAFSPDGELLASGSDDRTIKLWNVHNQQNIATFQHSNARIKSLTFSPNGRILATGGDWHVKLWNVGDWTEIATLRHEAWARALVFSPDGQFLAAGKGHEGPGIVTVWNVQTRQVIATLEGDSNRVRTLAFSPDNSILASSGRDRQLKLWEVSNWELLGEIPNTGHYDIAFSPDGKMIAGTNNGDVSLWWVEDGARVARLSVPTDRIHSVDFSHDENFLAVGAEDGIVRIYDNADSLRQAEEKKGMVRVIYFFSRDRTPEQDIDIKLNTLIKHAQQFYADEMERHGFGRKTFTFETDDTGKVLVHHVDGQFHASYYDSQNRRDWRGKVMSEIEERFDLSRNIYFVVIDYGTQRGGQGSTRFSGSGGEALVTTNGDCSCTTVGSFGWLTAHELGHAFGLYHDFRDDAYIMSYGGNLNRLSKSAAGWLNVYPYFNTNRKITTFNKPTTIRMLSPSEAAPNAIHLRFQMDDTDGLHQAQLLIPATAQNQDPGSLKLLNYKRLEGKSDTAEFIVTELTAVPNNEVTLQVIDVHGNFTNKRYPVKTRDIARGPTNRAGRINVTGRVPEILSKVTGDNQRGTPKNRLANPFVVLVWDADGEPVAGVQVTFRVKIGKGRLSVTNPWTDSNGRAQTFLTLGGSLINSVEASVSGVSEKVIFRTHSEPQVLITQSQRPPMYWVDTNAGTLHRLVGAKVETFLPSVQNATSLAVDMTDEKLYWAEKTGNRTGRIRRAHLDGTNVQLVRNLTSVPHSITIDTVNDKLYLTNSWGKIQRLNFNGSNFEPNLITDLDDPDHLALDVAGGKLYWTEAAGQIRRANLNGSDIETLAADLGVLGGIAIANDKLYWTEQTGESAGRIQRANLDGPGIQTLRSLPNVPLGITVDTVRRKLYWADSRDRIRRASLNGKNVQDVATGLRQPSGIVLGIVSGPTTVVAAPPMVESPDETGLLANYPNPFNPETWIPYQLSEPAEVTLTIYAVNGNVVRRLALGHQPSGMYHSKSRAAYWDGKNELGEAVASGVYFYTLSAGDFTATRKMFIRK